MAVDLPKRLIANRRSKGRKAPVSPNPQRQLLHKLYFELSKRTDSTFNTKVAKALCHTRRTMLPISVPKIAKEMSGKEDGIAVVVGSVVDNIRFLDNTPKMTVCAIRFTETARARITKAGGECLTFDKLALRAPLGQNCHIIRGDFTRRKQYKYFGPPAGLPGSTTKPRANAKYSR